MVQNAGLWREGCSQTQTFWNETKDPMRHGTKIYKAHFRPLVE